MKHILPFRSKFAPGQLVRISDLGIRLKVHHPGTVGTVTRCNFYTLKTIEVKVAGEDPNRPCYYSPDFWDAIPETASR